MVPARRPAPLSGEARQGPCLHHPPLPGEQYLCRLDEIPNGQSRGFIRQRNSEQVFAVRQNDTLYVYRNACPHQWLYMELARHKFLTRDGSEIMCYAHGARFDISTGLCTSGPCEGEHLIAIPHRIEAGNVFIPAHLPGAPE
jgi:nitrite reductase/ring-hydroxylating ferredoxin subunit